MIAGNTARIAKKIEQEEQNQGKSCCCFGSAAGSASEEDEKKLLKEREKRAKGIEERLYRSYNKLRENAKNGLAVVSVDRGACGGCYNTVPPQRQADIRDRKKLIVWLPIVFLICCSHPTFFLLKI